MNRPSPKRPSTQELSSQTHPTITEVTIQARPTTPAHRAHTRQGYGTARALLDDLALPPSRRKVTRSCPNTDPCGTKPHRAEAIESDTPDRRAERPAQLHLAPSRRRDQRLVQDPYLLRRANPAPKNRTLINHNGNPSAPPKRCSTLGPSASAIDPHEADQPAKHPTPRQDHLERTSLCRRGTCLGLRHRTAGSEDPPVRRAACHRVPCRARRHYRTRMTR